jgi:hypothetical protein
MVARQSLVAWALGFPLFVNCKLQDHQEDSVKDGDDFVDNRLGLYDYDGTPKPAVSSLKTLKMFAKDHRFTGFMDLAPSSLIAMKLEGASDVVVVLWPPAPDATRTVDQEVSVERERAS